jgi:hypothetical protein
MNLFLFSSPSIFLPISNFRPNQLLLFAPQPRTLFKSVHDCQKTDKMVLEHSNDVELKEMYGPPDAYSLSSPSCLGRPLPTPKVLQSNAIASGSGLGHYFYNSTSNLLVTDGRYPGPCHDHPFPDSSISTQNLDQESDGVDITDAPYEGKGKGKAVETDTGSATQDQADFKMAIATTLPLGNVAASIAGSLDRKACVACGRKPCEKCAGSSRKSQKSQSTNRTQFDVEKAGDDAPSNAPSTFAILNMVSLPRLSIDLTRFFSFCAVAKYSED